MNYKALLFLCLTVGIFSCKPKEKTAEVNYDNFLNEYIDSTVSPGEDFFKFAMGKWLKNNPIPESERSWGIWTLVNEENYSRIRKINEEAAANTKAKKGSNEQKIGDFWFTGMDTVTIEKQGITPLKPELDKIAAISDPQGVIKMASYLHTMQVQPLFGNYIFQDEKNSSKFRLHFYQGGIGLPDRDYYFDKDERTVTIRNEYVKHISKMFQLTGIDAATADTYAQTIMKMETDFAGASRKLADLRDPYANYNSMAVADVNKLCPAINWESFLADAGIKNIDTIIVGQPEFFKQLNTSLTKESVDNWKIYLQWNLINAYADRLSSDFDKEHFHFYGTILNGTKEQRARWKRVLDAEEDAMGFLLGQLYVEAYYPPEEKARYEKIVENTMAAYKVRIQQLNWMSPETKEKALLKLSTVIKKVGYPDKWRDYSALTITRDSYVQNAINANKYLHAYEVEKLYKPVDKTEWEMTPQTWNAYYNPSNNEIVLPAAAFIVPGVPDKYVDDAIAYGYAAGSTIGHEITHGFDDQGSQFDEKGNLSEWWTPQDRAQFLERTKLIVEQFNNYIIIDTIHVNGDATQGENIADLGGMLIGLEAFKMTDQYKEGKVIGGYTPVQRYFLGFALSWYGKYRDEAMVLRAKTDVHSPNFLRVNGPASNIQEFYDAFGIKQGDKMYVDDSLRVKIW